MNVIDFAVFQWGFDEVARAYAKFLLLSKKSHNLMIEGMLESELWLFTLPNGRRTVKSDSLLRNRMVVLSKVEKGI